MRQKVNDIAEVIRKQVHALPSTGIVLGSGLGGLVNEIRQPIELLYKDLEGFPMTTVEGHKGKMIFGQLGNQDVMVMQGRVHFYEGVSIEDIVLPVCVMKQLGVHLLILSNASGGLHPSFQIGDLMLVTDQINLMNATPRMDTEEAGTIRKHTDMSEVFDRKLIALAKRVAKRHTIPLQSGILAAVTGPVFETKAEYAYIRYLGADAVGMSIIPEAIAARQLGISCLAITVISDLGIRGKITQVSHEEVQQAARKTEPRMTLLITKLLEAM
ncbi:MAG: purine-nucleoside phosphorylase [Bacteroidales bacterium]|nr:purine-nucleoside phosphorylase [Bacteroidales bacterium]